MRSLICILLLLSQTSYAKIKIDEFVTKKKPQRKVAQFDLITKAQESFDHFIKCSEQVDNKTSPLESPATKCIQEQFFSTQSIDAIIHYFSWFQSNTKISNLYPCQGDLLSLAQDFKAKPKDLSYCIKTQNEMGTQEGIIWFRVREEHLKILKIKLM